MTQKADTKFKREANQGSHDFNLACEVLDAGKVCHVGFTLDDQPYVVPLSLTAGEPIDAPDLLPGMSRPDYL
jgi:hypothetical protein